MMFHSQEVIPNASPYTRNERDVRKYLDLLKKIFTYALTNDIQFTTLEEVHSIMEQKGNEKIYS